MVLFILLGLFFLSVLYQCKLVNDLEVMNQEVKKEIFYYTPDLNNINSSKLPVSITLSNKVYRRAVFAGIVVGKQLLIGKAECSPKDQFIKKYGRNLAKGRALSQTPLKVVKIKDESKVIELFHNTVKELL